MRGSISRLSRLGLTETVGHRRFCGVILCNKTRVAQVTGISVHINDLGLLSSASQLVLGANAAPCEPVLTAQLSSGNCCYRLRTVVDMSRFLPVFSNSLKIWTVRPDGTGCRRERDSTDLFRRGVILIRCSSIFYIPERCTIGR